MQAIVLSEILNKTGRKRTRMDYTISRLYLGRENMARKRREETTGSDRKQMTKLKKEVSNPD